MNGKGNPSYPDGHRESVGDRCLIRQISPQNSRRQMANFGPPFLIFQNSGVHVFDKKCIFEVPLWFRCSGKKGTATQHFCWVFCVCARLWRSAPRSGGARREFDFGICGVKWTPAPVLAPYALFVKIICCWAAPGPLTYRLKALISKILQNLKQVPKSPS